MLSVGSLCFSQDNSDMSLAALLDELVKSKDQHTNSLPEVKFEIDAILLSEDLEQEFKDLISISRTSYIFIPSIYEDYNSDVLSTKHPSFTSPYDSDLAYYFGPVNSLSDELGRIDCSEKFGLSAEDNPKEIVKVDSSFFLSLMYFRTSSGFCTKVLDSIIGQVAFPNANNKLSRSSTTNHYDEVIISRDALFYRFNEIKTSTP